VFLMDEPLSNLDAKLRVQMRNDIAEIQDRLGVTTIYVTHDQVEAMTMADRVAVMRKGTLQQVDPPQSLYDRPMNLFVAAFIGSPPMNLVEAHLTACESGVEVILGDQTLLLPAESRDSHPGMSELINSQAAVVVGIRPEDLEDADLLPSERSSQIEVKVNRVASLGSEVEIHFGLDVPPVATEEARVAKGEAIELVPTEKHATCIATLNPRTKVRPGDLLRLTVDLTRMHFFDRTTGLRI
jgi:multiple sugar transport system ATP-binding protein